MLECWFDFASNYSYLSVMRLEQQAAQHGVAVAWRPFLLGPIFQSLGWNNSPFVLQQAKGRYVWEDMPRQCDKYGIAWRQPSQFPRRQLLPTRVALLIEQHAWIGTYCRRIMQMNFAQDRDIDNADAVSEALSGLDAPVEALLAQAAQDQTKQRLRQRCEQARERGIFGAPTFLLGDSMYWGNDRLDDALQAAAAAAAKQPKPAEADSIRF